MNHDSSNFVQKLSDHPLVCYTGCAICIKGFFRSLLGLNGLSNQEEIFCGECQVFELCQKKIIFNLVPYLVNYGGQ
jgi:hypothetical protein